MYVYRTMFVLLPFHFHFFIYFFPAAKYTKLFTNAFSPLFVYTIRQVNDCFGSVGSFNARITFQSVRYSKQQLNRVIGLRALCPIKMNIFWYSFDCGLFAIRKKWEIISLFAWRIGCVDGGDNCFIVIETDAYAATSPCEKFHFICSQLSSKFYQRANSCADEKCSLIETMEVHVFAFDFFRKQTQHMLPSAHCFRPVPRDFYFSYDLRCIHFLIFSRQPWINGRVKLAEKKKTTN